jgi:hypothetical protein
MNPRIAGEDGPAPERPVINMLWIGPCLGSVERACMRSVMACGHPLHLWHYAPIDGVPEGVVRRDAAAVIPESRVFRHEPTGSYALFSNLFRYTLLQNGDGIWMDCDVYLLKAISPQQGYLLGWAQPGVIGTAVLGLPAESPILEELIGYFDASRIPPWLPLRWRLRFGWQRLAAGRYRIETMPWGHLGPQAVSRMVDKHRLGHVVLPQEILSPWTYLEAGWIVRTDAALEDHVSAETVAVHLFNQMIRDFKNQPAPSGSFLARLQREGA